MKFPNIENISDFSKRSEGNLMKPKCPHCGKRINPASLLGSITTKRKP
jgi:uncharacterized OB-fold protein